MVLIPRRFWNIKEGEESIWWICEEYFQDILQSSTHVSTFLFVLVLQKKSRVKEKANDS